MINNCVEYNNTESSCARCEDGYLLLVLANDVHRCLVFTETDELCETAVVVEEAYGNLGMKNQFECTRCKNNNIDYVLETFNIGEELFKKVDFPAL